MKIVAIETLSGIRVPCDIGATPIAFLGVGWSSLDTLLVRVVTDQGLEGWDEGFGHACCPATRIVVDTQLSPAWCWRGRARELTRELWRVPDRRL